MPNSVFAKLVQSGNIYSITQKRNFCPIASLPMDLVKKVFDFSYQMTFANKGEHRDHRTGGTHQRKNGEIFANTFQGKLAEYAVFKIFKESGLDVNEPDLSVFGLGVWDSVDIIVENVSVSIKSTKSFGNLLLLETKDWDEEANYLPNGKWYDYTFLVRMDPFCEDLLKRNRFLYSTAVDRMILFEIISSVEWRFDIAGYVSRDDLKYIITNNYVIPQGALLNGRTRMDASNYYVQSGDMKPLSSFLSEINYIKEYRN